MGVKAAPERTMRAPSGPPIQFHHGVERSAADEGNEGRMKSITTAAVMMVPVMEKKVAQRTSLRLARRDELAAAWMEIAAPAAVARSRKIKYIGAD